jgi:translation initiation factor IF-1
MSGAPVGGGRRASAEVVEMRPNAIVRVKLEDGRELDCHLSGKSRMSVIRLVPGAKVTVEVSLFDTGRGRIVDEGRS